MSFRLTIEIGRAAQEVFDFLADSTNMPLWYDAVRSARQVDDGPIEEGTRYRILRDLPAGPVENVAEIEEYRPGEVVSLTSVEGPTPFTYRYSVVPSARGATVTLEGEISAKGLTGPVALLAPMASRLFARGMERNLETLKRHLEARSVMTSRAATAGL